MRITASKLYIVEKCPAAAALPVVEEEAGAPAAHGKLVHGYVEEVGSAMKDGSTMDEAREDALADIPSDDTREVCEEINLARLPLGGDWSHEVGYAYEVATGRVLRLGANMSRGQIDQAAFPDDKYITGIVDLEGVSEHLSAVVDIKTGWRYLGPAKDSMQLLFAAVCVSRFYGRDFVEVAHLFLRQGQRPWYDSAALDGLDLGAAEQRLIDAHRAAMADRAEMRPRQVIDMDTGERGEAGVQRHLHYSLGAHCTYCPAKLHCEAQTKLIRAMANRPVTLEEMVKEKLTVQTAAQAAVRLEVLQQAITRAYAALYAFAAEQDVPMPDGQVLGKRIKKTKRWNVEATAQGLTSVLGAKLAMAAFALKPSLGRIEAIARQLVKGDPKASPPVPPQLEMAQALLPAPGKGEKPPKLTIGAVKEALVGGYTKRDVVEQEVVDIHRPGQADDDEE